MEFFAVLGLITVAVIIIGLAKESRRKSFAQYIKKKIDEAE
jgi:hypothetical protein